MQFQGKVVLITGAAGGIGKETARLFAEQGAKLALVDVNEEALETVARELSLQEYILVPTDVSDEEQVRRYVQSTIDAYGKIDIFFNNAGIEGKFGMITDTSAADLDQVLNVNVKGVFYGLKHVLTVMKEQRSGSIVNSASIGGLKGGVGLSPYIASKHAVIGLTASAALEYAEYGIRVNAICPSQVNTRMMRSIEAGRDPQHPEKMREMLENRVPLKRFAEPSEIAELVLFLASDKASFITGSAYRADGGLLA